MAGFISPQMPYTLRSFSVLAAAVVLSVGSLSGSAFSINQLGARATGMGTAFTAIADDVSGSFPFLAHFNQDGTWTSDDARALGLIPPFQQATMLTGSWVRTGERKVAWRGIEILKSAVPIEVPPGSGAFTSWFLLVGQGSHEIAPGDPNHAIHGTGSTSLYACLPDASNATGFTCPTLDAIQSGAVPALPGGFPPFTFTLTRIRP